MENFNVNFEELARHREREREMHEAAVARHGIRKALALDAFVTAMKAVTSINKLLAVTSNRSPVIGMVADPLFEQLVQELFSLASLTGASDADLVDNERTTNSKELDAWMKEMSDVCLSHLDQHDAAVKRAMGKMS